MTKATEHKYCLNCNSSYPEGINQSQEYFCINCGQSNLDSKLSFGRLIRDALSNIFNLDSRLIHTFRDLLHPSKLTKTYIEGKRKYYVNPARLFVFMLLALITISLFCIKLDNSDMSADDFYTKAERSKLMQEYNNLVDTIDISGHEEIIDSIQNTLFFAVTQIDKDTLENNGIQFFNLKRPIKSFGITRYDGVHLSQKKLFEKYNITNFWDKINVGQYLRFTKNPVGGIKHIVQNLTWAVFITVLLISFFMKLLYIRRNYYLVEHVVLILNSHSLLFFFLAIYLLFNNFVELGNQDGDLELIIFLVAILIIYTIQFLTLKKYYHQGFFKTFIKQILINSVYFIIFIFTVIVVALISLILY